MSIYDNLNLLTDFAMEQAEFASEGDLDRVESADAALRRFIRRASEAGVGDE